MKLGILGAGGIASTMAKTVAEMKGVEAYAVADVYKRQRQRFFWSRETEKSCLMYRTMKTQVYRETAGKWKIRQGRNWKRWPLHRELKKLWEKNRS